MHVTKGLSLFFFPKVFVFVLIMGASPFALFYSQTLVSLLTSFLV